MQYPPLNRSCRVVQWIRRRTLTCEVPGSNPLAAAVVSLGKALYPHCLVLRRGLKAVGPLVTCLQAICFLSGQVKQIKSNQNQDFIFVSIDLHLANHG